MIHLEVNQLIFILWAMTEFTPVEAPNCIYQNLEEPGMNLDSVSLKGPRI